jgi:ABC-type nitrate/sulfonate/bicarbonate transport system ATPase subunit
MTRAQLMGAFGLDPAALRAEQKNLQQRCAGAARQLDEALRAGEVGVVAGPSGAGKSTTLRALASRVRRRGGEVLQAPVEAAAPPAKSAIVELLDAPTDLAMRILAGAGLAEARILALRPDQLSSGQRARFELAQAMARAGRAASRGNAVTLLIDEFASGLDALAARGLACSFGRWVRRSPARVVVAGARLDIEAIGADLLVTLGDASAGEAAAGAPVQRRPRSAHSLPVTIERATMADYRALAPCHYAAGSPGPVCLTLRAIDRATGALAGVLVVSRPTLNARWRRIAWPGEYEDTDLRARARRINADIRIISRLIVEPRVRGCGVGTALVRAYLAAPLTPRTEAVTAMGAICPVFERTGMTPVRLAQRPQDGRLARYLQRRDIPAERLGRIAEPDDDLLRELRTWANASRRTRPLLNNPPLLHREATRALLADPVAYVKAES